MNTPLDDVKQLLVPGTAGRDASKTFRITEVAPVAMAGFVLRMLAALKLGQKEDLRALLQPGEDADLREMLGLLAGCDPHAVTALINDALIYVEVAADPRHPTAFRPLHDNDIREMSTLMDILSAFSRVNLQSG